MWKPWKPLHQFHIMPWWFKPIPQKLISMIPHSSFQQKNRVTQSIQISIFSSQFQKNTMLKKSFSIPNSEIKFNFTPTSSQQFALSLPGSMVISWLKQGRNECKIRTSCLHGEEKQSHEVSHPIILNLSTSEFWAITINSKLIPKTRISRSKNITENQTHSQPKPDSCSLWRSCEIKQRP